MVCCVYDGLHCMRSHATYTYRARNFNKLLVTHALDATGARDFMLDVLTANATLQSLWSRLAEELIMWSSYEFRTVTLDDGFAMGSSMMPQKKNPGPLELLRGRAGIVNGYAFGGYTMLHGLPSGYNRDFHEEKELLFASMAIRAAGIIPALVESTTLNFDRMAELCDKNFMMATELANYLVEDHDVPFRETHHIVGSLVGELVKTKSDLTDIEAVMKHLKESGIDANVDRVKAVLDPKTVMMTYNSLGGTGPAGPEAMQAILSDLQYSLDAHKATLTADQARVSNAYEATKKIADACQQGSVTDLESLRSIVAQQRVGLQSEAHAWSKR
jgi:argininosuccinate lyase